MIKVEKDSIRSIIPFLLFVLTRDIEAGDVIDGLSRSQVPTPDGERRDYISTLSPAQQQAWIEFLNRYDGGVNLSEIVEELALSLQQEEDSASDGRLIEELVELCKMNGSRNRLGYKFMHQLRRILLLPHESRAVLNEMRNEVCCTSCGHRFQTREAGTVLIEQAENGGHVQLSVICTTCSSPARKACLHKGCHESPALSAEEIKAFASKDCGGHKEKRKKEESPVSLDVETEGPIFTMMNAGERADGPEPDILINRFRRAAENLRFSGEVLPRTEEDALRFWRNQIPTPPTRRNR